MKRMLIFGSLCVVFCGICRADTIADYYFEMVDKGSSKFPLLSGQQKLGEKDVFLVVGDIVSFVGERNLVRFPIDALIVSTNVQLRFDTNSPRIQSSLRSALPASKRREVEDVFRAEKELRAVTEALDVDFGTFSPRRICFLATDRFDGGTHDDPKWQKNLEFERIGIGVKLCIDKLRAQGARTIVLPLIGSSINPKVEDKEYIDVEDLRVQHIERRARSLRGIVSGIDSAVGTSGEFGIVVWDTDVQRIIEPKYLKERGYRERADATGFWGLRRQMLGVLNESAH